MAVLDPTYRKQIQDIKINYKQLEKLSTKDYSDGIKEYIESTEYKILLWINADKLLSTDKTIIQWGIITQLVSYSIIIYFINNKKQISEYIIQNNANNIISSIDSAKNQIEQQVWAYLNQWWSYEAYVFYKLSDNKDIYRQLDEKLLALDSKIVEVTELNSKLTAEQGEIISTRKLEFEDVVNKLKTDTADLESTFLGTILNSKQELLKITEDFKIEKRDELAERYASIFEERAEGKEGVFEFKIKIWFIDWTPVKYIFKKDGYMQISKMWLRFLIILIVLGLFSIPSFEYILYHFIYQELPHEIKNSPDFVKNLPLYFGSLKVTFFSIIGYMIFVANKNYSNNRHLYNIYRQKADSLKIFRAYTETVTDEKAQNEISTMIAKTIFENVETGYIKQTAEGNSIIENLINVTKSK